MTTPSPRPDRVFPCLNGIRALAALAVVTTHVSFQTGTTVRGGPAAAAMSRLDLGVAVFFVLSGFLLSRPYFLAAATNRTRPRTRNYLWKRALRILPTYWLAVAAAFIIVAEARDQPPVQWLRQVTLTQVYERGLADLPGLTQTWSLAVEATFYLALPVLAWVLVRITGGWHPRRLLVAIAVLIAIGPVWLATVRLGDAVTAAMLGLWLPAFLSWFGTGMALAAVSVDVDTRQSAWSRTVDRLAEDAGTWWLGAAAVFAIVATPVGGPWLLDFASGWTAVTKNVLYAIIAGALLLPVTLGSSPRRGAVRQVLSHPVASYLGDLSYAVFCVHLIVMQVMYMGLDVKPFEGRFGVVWLLTVLGSIAVAALIYRFVESPLRRFRGVGLRSPAQAATTAATSAATETKAAN